MTRRALWRLSGAASFLIAAVTCTTGVDPVAVATVVVNPPNDSVRVAAEQRVTVQVFDRNNNLVTGRKITFRSNEPAIATVDSNGVVRGVAVGTVLIVATVEGKSGQASFKVIAAVDRVAIAPLTADVSLGASRQLAANVLDRSGNAIPGRLVIWSSSNSGVATVSTAGLVSAVSLGRATITATSDGKSGTATIDVVDPVASVRITPVGPQTLRVGGRVQLTATPFNAAGQQLGPRPTTWVSSNPNVASVTASGEVTAISVGQATITAEIESRQAQAPVSVTLIPVSSVTLTPSSLAMFRGDARQLTLTATDSTGATITNFQGRTVSFQSSNLPVA
ncbi:MAG: Ig-like domain-containing protein, partial [Gemmatimonadaceae bacterium]